MPEGPEIALTAEILNKKLRNKTLVSFDFISGRYVTGRTQPKGFDKFNELLPMKLTKVDSKGKLMWMEFKTTDGDHWYMWNTFGMTGMWSFFEPRSCRAMLTFSDDTVAYYSDQRNFGTFVFTDDVENLNKKLSELPPDLLKDPDVDFSKLTTYKKPIVDILTDQKHIGSGIGNYLIAEILYRAKLSPHRFASSLTEDEVQNLNYWIAYMLKLSYESNNIGYMINLTKEASKIKRHIYHPDIKIKKSDKDFDLKVYQKKKDPLGNKVTAEEIRKGRTMWWVKAVQK